MTFPSQFQGKKKPKKRWTGWWHHLRSCHSHLNFISLKAKDSRRFTSAYHYAAGLLSGMGQVWENMIHKYIFLCDELGMWRWGNILMEVSLSRPPYLTQTVCKEQRSSKGEKEVCGGGGGGGGGEQPQVKEPQDCWLCQTHTARVTQSTQPELSPWQGEPTFCALISVSSLLFPG